VRGHCRRMVRCSRGPRFAGSERDRTRRPRRGARGRPAWGRREAPQRPRAHRGRGQEGGRRADRGGRAPARGRLRLAHGEVWSADGDLEPGKDELDPIRAERDPTEDDVCPTRDEVFPIKDDLWSFKDGVWSFKDDVCPAKDDVCLAKDEVARGASANKRGGRGVRREWGGCPGLPRCCQARARTMRVKKPQVAGQRAAAVVFRRCLRFQEPCCVKLRAGIDYTPCMLSAWGDQRKTILWVSGV